MIYQPIPAAGAARIFFEVWTHYCALIETPDHTEEIVDFLLDVESQITRLYPFGAPDIRFKLIMEPQCRGLRATRAALGCAFLMNGLWPVKNYFANGR